MVLGYIYTHMAEYFKKIAKLATIVAVQGK